MFLVYQMGRAMDGEIALMIKGLFPLVEISPSLLGSSGFCEYRRSLHLAWKRVLLLLKENEYLVSNIPGPLNLSVLYQQAVVYRYCL